MKLSDDLKTAFQEHVPKNETVLSVKLTDVYGIEKFEVFTEKAYYLFDRDMKLIYFQAEGR